MTADPVLMEWSTAVRLRLEVCVFDLRQEREMLTDVRLRVLEAFRESDIEPALTLRPSGRSSRP